MVVKLAHNEATKICIPHFNLWFQINTKWGFTFTLWWEIPFMMNNHDWRQDALWHLIGSPLSFSLWNWPHWPHWFSCVWVFPWRGGWPIRAHGSKPHWMRWFHCPSFYRRRWLDFIYFCCLGLRGRLDTWPRAWGWAAWHLLFMVCCWVLCFTQCRLLFNHYKMPLKP